MGKSEGTVCQAEGTANAKTQRKKQAREFKGPEMRPACVMPRE